MNEHMKEAERLIECLRCSMTAGSWDEYRAALLAHIQRGAVPMKLNAGFYTLVAEKPFAEHDHPEWRHMYRIVADDNGRVLGYISDPSMLAAAPAPDHFRDAAKMVAAPADPDPLHLSRILHELAGAASLCWEPRPTGVFDSQLAIQFVEQALAEIRSRMMPAPAEVPMPEPDGTAEVNIKPLPSGGYQCGYVDAWSEPLMRAFRAAGEAAGYARGLADGQGHCRRLTETDKAQAAATLRGEVKP